MLKNKEYIKSLYNQQRNPVNTFTQWKSKKKKRKIATKKVYEEKESAPEPKNLFGEPFFLPSEEPPVVIPLVKEEPLEEPYQGIKPYIPKHKSKTLSEWQKDSPCTMESSAEKPFSLSLIKQEN